jgi:hypothetical protein
MLEIYMAMGIDEFIVLAFDPLSLASPEVLITFLLDQPEGHLVII